MDIALSVSVAIGAVLPGISLEVPAGIRVEDPSDIALDLLGELFVVFGTEMEASGMGGKPGFITTGAVKNETRAATEEIGRLVFFCPFELRDSDVGIFSPPCGRFAFAVETVGTLATFALTGSIERYKAHMAEKMPEFPGAGLELPSEPRVELGAPVGFADWMAMVTGEFRFDRNAEIRTRSTWMHLMRQPAAARRDEEGGAEQEWNQANPNHADGRQEDCNEL